MRNILITITTGMSLLLGGCASTGGGPPTQTDISNLISQVQTYTDTACGFVPTATTIANIIAAGNPAVTAATSIAQAICSAVVTPKSAGRTYSVRNVKGYSVTPGMVNGVAVQGNRTR